MIERKDLVDDIVPSFSNTYIRDQDTKEYSNLLKKQEDQLRRLRELEKETSIGLDEVINL